MAIRVGYCRVSTASGEQLSALEHQISRIEAAGVERVITDVESGMNSERPGLLELMDLIDSRKVSEVVATRVDRLGRDATATDSLIVLAGKRGVKITTLDGGEIEAQTPTGFLMARLSTSLAEMESKMLSMRIRRGLEARRAKHMPARGKAPWGYRISADKTKIEPDPEEWERARAFLKVLQNTHWRMNTALDRFQGPIPLSSCRAVRAWLVNPILRGGIGYGQRANHVFDEIHWNQHQPLIDPEVWPEIELQLDENRRRWGNNVNLTPNLLSGLCWCPNCGKRVGYAGGRKHPALICRTRGCISQYKGTHESLISTELNRALSARAEELVSRTDQSNPEVDELERQIAKLTEFHDPDLETAIEAKREKLKQLRTARTPREELMITALSDPRCWDEAEKTELRSVYLNAVSRVWVDRGQVTRIDLKI